MKIRDVIGSAFEELGLASWQYDITPDELQGALRRLRAQMASWSTQGIRCGFNTGAELEDESGLPDSVLEAVYTNLACKIAPGFGRTIPSALSALANDSYESALVQFSMIIPQQLSPMLPAGAGNKYWRGYNQAFPNRNEPAIDAGSDSELEF